MNAALAARSAGLWSNLVLALLAPVAVLCTSFAAEPAPGDATATLPVISADETVQKELLNLDRLLDTNPKLEETLRTNIDRLSDENFQKQNPEVAALVKKNPGVVKALRTERHFLVLRAVGRLARGKLLHQDIVDLNKYLDTHAEVREALAKRPNQIVQTDFLIAHPSFAKFMEDHPGLSTVLLERADKREKDKAAKKKA